MRGDGEEEEGGCGEEEEVRERKERKALMKATHERQHADQLHTYQDGLECCYARRKILQGTREQSCACI